MALQIPSIPPFNPRGDQNSVSQRWTKWRKRFQHFILASKFTDDIQKNALLLHMVGQDTQDIFDTLTIPQPQEEGQTYQASINALDQHFSIKKNIPFERSIFRVAKQLEKESIEQYIMRLQQLAQYCEYGDKIENNIRYQIISSCISSKLRKRLLTEPELTLNKLAQIAQAMEDASHYTKQIEEKNQLSTQIIESMNKLTIPKPPQHPKPLHHQPRFPRKQNFQQNTNQQTRLPPKGCY